MFHAMAPENCCSYHIMNPNFWSRISGHLTYIPKPSHLQLDTCGPHTHTHTHTHTVPSPSMTHCPAFSECRCTGWAWTILLIHILSSRERRTIIPGPSGFGDRNHRHHHRCAGGKEFCGLQQCTQCAEPGRVGVHHDCRLLLHQWEILG